jgi:hypothetical protein
MGSALQNRAAMEAGFPAPALMLSTGAPTGRFCKQSRRSCSVAVRPNHLFPRATFHKDGFLPPDAVSASVRGNWAICASAWVALFSSIAKRARATA